MKEINLTKDNRAIAAVGDSHTLGRRLREELEIENCIFIHVGDLSFGFDSDEDTNLNQLNHTLSERNSHLFAIRGNHDSPDYFKELNEIRSNITLLPDYSYLNTQKGKILCVGGAVSIDRQARAEFTDYWPAEKFALKPELVQKVDILITHTGPNWIGASCDNDFVGRWAKNDKNLLADLKAERAAMDELYRLAAPRRSYLGHFHKSETAELNGCRARVLDILEIIEIY